MSGETEIIPRQTISQMVAIYNESIADLLKAFDLLSKTSQRLDSTFGEYTSIAINTAHINYDDPQKQIEKINRDIWRALFEKTEIKRFLTAQRIKEINDNIDNNEMPPITEENIFQMMQHAAQNVNSFIHEAVLEAYNLLRPHASYYKGYKTNQKFQNEIGASVIIPHVVERKYKKKSYTIKYRSINEFRVIANIFRILDGKKPQTYYGEIYDAIEASENNIAESEYFKIKCYKNNNMHITFKRIDLVKKINSLVGGMAIKNN